MIFDHIEWDEYNLDHATKRLLSDAQDEDLRDVHRDDEYGAFRATG